MNGDNFSIFFKNGWKTVSLIFIVQIVFVLTGFVYSQVPDFYWAKRLGGFSAVGHSLALDPMGNVYTVGHFKGSGDFDPGTGSMNFTSAGSDDGYISKLDRHGNFVWAKQVGGSDWDQAVAITVDGANNLYVTGYFEGTVSFGSTTLIASSPRDIFVCKLDDLGNFLWAKSMPGDDTGVPYSVATDSQNNVIITGGFKGTVDFNPNAGNFNLTSFGNEDVFVVKLDPTGNFLWAKQMGGTELDRGNSVTVDNSDDIILTGRTKGVVDFNGTTLNTVESTNVFICKLANDGTQQWVKQFEGTTIGTTIVGPISNPVIVPLGSFGTGMGVVTDNTGNIYTTGYYKGNVDFDPDTGTFYIPSVDSTHEDVFVSKLNNQGDFQWAKMIGGTPRCQAWGIDVNALGYVYYTGRFSGTIDFDPSVSGTYNLTSGYSSGGSDAFIGILDFNGDFVWTGQFEGSDGHINIGRSIKADDEGRIHTTGYFGGIVDFNPIGSNVYHLTTPNPSSVNPNAFVHKLADTLNASFTASNNNICVGDSITFTDHSTGMGIVSWNWIFNGGTPSSASNQGPHTITFSNSGTYNIILEIEDNFGDTDDTTIVVTVNAQPIADANAINTTICEGEDLELTAGNVPGATYYWSGPNGYSSNTQNPIIINTTSSNAGTYTLTVSNNGCIDDDDVSITIDPQPTATANATSTMICEGEDINLTANTVSGSTYSWSGPGGYSSNNQNPTISSTTSSDGGTYTLTVTLGGCSDDEDVIITVNPLPTMTVNPTDPSCGNNNGEIVIVPASGFTITDYSIDNGTTTQTAGTFSNLTSGSYTAYVQDNNGCEATQSVSLNNPGGPTIDDIVATETSCTSDDGTITITASGGTGTLQYSIDNGTTFQSSGSFTGLGAGNYDVVVKDNNDCETNGTVTIDEMNAPSIVLVNSEDASCFGASDGSAIVDATGGTSSYTYSWSPSGGNGSTATNLPSGTYDVTVEDDAGCSDDLQITISEPDEITVSEVITNTDCGLDNGEIELTVTGGSGNYTYDWSPNVSTSNQATDLAVGTYEVIVTDGNGCSQTVSYDVVTGNSFYIEVTPDSFTIEKEESANINLFVDPNVTVESIVWTPSAGLSCSDCADPIASPKTSTTYIVTVTDENGCTAVDTVKIIVVLPCAAIFVPNTFSPNNDGLNDLECVLGDCIASMEFTIYNRWGEPIFSTKTQEECWDGTFRGKLVQTGVYAYKLKATLDNGERIEESGNITVVR